MDDYRGAYPTSTPGAAAVTTTTIIEYDPTTGEVLGHIKLTATEQGASQRDIAAADLERYLATLERWQRDGALLAGLAVRYGIPGVDATTVQARIKAGLSALGARHDIWCTNCSTHGIHSPREQGKTLCSWCSDIQIEWGTLPTKGLLDIRASGRKVNVNDIVRHFDRDAPGWKRNRPKAKKGNAA